MSDEPKSLDEIAQEIVNRLAKIELDEYFEMDLVAPLTLSQEIRLIEKVFHLTSRIPRINVYDIHLRVTKQ
jgi:hypothetical protein